VSGSVDQPVRDEGSSCVGRGAVCLAIAALTSGCDPTVIIGARVAPDATADDGAAAVEDAKGPVGFDSPVDGEAADATADADGGADGMMCGDGGASEDASAPVAFPWTTGFENGLCAYTSPSGFCIATGSGSITLVTSPVHSGQYAAAFVVGGDVDASGAQARCVRQGTFPTAAYYGAWYYLPAFPANRPLWNLWHFQAGTPQAQHGLWDVSLVNWPDGSVHLSMFDFLNGITVNPTGVPPIPIGRWFHIEMYFKRANDTTGELAMFQDGALAASLVGVRTDDTNWGQWYVGNLEAIASSAPLSTVYVDDIAMSAQP
jgi:hypothetical protein